MRTLAYVGSRTTRERNARGEGITVYRVEAGGGLERVQLLADLTNPSYLALNDACDRLYAIHGDHSEVSAFAIGEDGLLSHINTVSCEGKNPVHLALAPSRRHLLVSNHLSGTVAVIGLCESGALERVTQLAKLDGAPGPHRVQQPFSKPHFNAFDKGGRFVLVPDKGLDRIFSFEFRDGALHPSSGSSVKTRSGAGPRHLCFGVVGAFVYVVNELDSTVTTYRFNRSTGELAPLQILTTLPEEFTGESQAAAICIDQAGLNVYVSNRGHDSVAHFQVSATTGLLRSRGTRSTGGQTPRHIALNPNGHLLYALNEDSDTIVSMKIDPGSGALDAASGPVRCGSPVCMVFSHSG